MKPVSRALLVVPLVSGCFHPGGGSQNTDTNASSGTGGSSGSSMTAATSPTGGPGTSGVGSSGGGSVCGDGMVTGNEVCDDGVNDGSYGSCTSDCSAQAAHCGDGNVDTPNEVCDDGVNDGSYGGCASDCSALGPHCGDGQVQGPEGCDNGSSNANGSGCNVDCVVSGTAVGMWNQSGLSFCDGTFVTRPAFRDNGDALVAFSGYCPGDTLVLDEFAPDVSVVNAWGGDVLLSNTPVEQGILRGDDWLLAASGCNYLIATDGTLTEVCEMRTYGTLALGIGGGGYFALESTLLAEYPTTSPMLGDSPTWSQPPPDALSYTYIFNGATAGASNSVAVVGSQTFSTSNPVGWVGRYTSGGNLAVTQIFPAVSAFFDAVTAPDGTVLAMAANSPDQYRVTRLDSGYQEAWSLDLDTDGQFAAAFDSTSALVLLYHDPAMDQLVLHKLAAADQSEMWSLAVPGIQIGRIAVDKDDAIWVAGATGNSAAVFKVSP